MGLEQRSLEENSEIVVVQPEVHINVKSNIGKEKAGKRNAPGTSLNTSEGRFKLNLGQAKPVSSPMPSGGAANAAKILTDRSDRNVVHRKPLLLDKSKNTISEGDSPVKSERGHLKQIDKSKFTNKYLRM